LTISFRGQCRLIQAMSFQVMEGANSFGMIVLPPTAVDAPGGRNDSKLRNRGIPSRISTSRSQRGWRRMSSLVRNVGFPGAQ